MAEREPPGPTPPATKRNTRLQSTDSRRVFVRSKMVASDRWNRATLNAHIGRVKRTFKWAASNELIPVSVFTALSTVEGLRRGRTAVPEPGNVLPV